MNNDNIYFQPTLDNILIVKLHISVGDSLTLKEKVTTFTQQNKLTNKKKVYTLTQIFKNRILETERKQTMSTFCPNYIVLNK